MESEVITVLNIQGAMRPNGFSVWTCEVVPGPADRHDLAAARDARLLGALYRSAAGNIRDHRATHRDSERSLQILEDRSYPVVGPAPLRVPKTAEVLAGRIRVQIIRGELPEGESLPSENELMQQYGVSRHVLREAHRILEAERLITVRRGTGGGPLVLSPDPQVAARYVGTILQVRGTTLADLQRVRIAMEPVAVRWLTESPHVEKALVTLRRHNDQVAASVRDQATFSYLSFEFHRLVVELSENQTLRVLMDLISEIAQVHIATRQTSPEGDLEERVHANKLATRANAKVLRLVESGDADAAEAYWREHLQAVVARLSQAEGPLTVLDLFT